MAASVRNQRQLRAFLAAVRTRHGLSKSDFAQLIGLKQSIYYAFDGGKRKLGYRSVRAIAEKLSWQGDLIAAMIDPKAELATLPSPDSVHLPASDATRMPSEVLIDIEAISRMKDYVNAAGEPVPLSQLFQFIH